MQARYIFSSIPYYVLIRRDPRILDRETCKIPLECFLLERGTERQVQAETVNMGKDFSVQ